MFKFLAATAALSLVTMPAIAQAPDDMMSIRVSHADLDLSAPAGAARMAMRLRSAVRRVCQQQAGGLAGRTAEQRCRKTVSAAADARLAMLVRPAPVQVASLR